ncbi:hypothetical protein D3C80_1764030 [compost metagenome]
MPVFYFLKQNDGRRQGRTSTGAITIESENDSVRMHVQASDLLFGNGRTHRGYDALVAFLVRADDIKVALNNDR